MIAICSNFQDLVMRASLQVSMITVPTRLKISTSEKFEMVATDILMLSFNYIHYSNSPMFYNYNFLAFVEYFNHFQYHL